jgi:hypothetical protein
MMCNAWVLKEGCAKHTARMGTQEMHAEFWWGNLLKLPSEIRRRRLADYITMNLRKTGRKNGRWMELAQDRLKLRGFSVNILKFRFPCQTVMTSLLSKLNNQNIKQYICLILVSTLITHLLYDTASNTDTICHRQYWLKWINEGENKRLGKWVRCLDNLTILFQAGKLHRPTANDKWTGNDVGGSSSFRDENMGRLTRRHHYVFIISTSCKNANKSSCICNFAPCLIALWVIVHP